MGCVKLLVNCKYDIKIPSVIPALLFIKSKLPIIAVKTNCKFPIFQTIGPIKLEYLFAFELSENNFSFNILNSSFDISS